jgi:hypothetical protein
MQYSQLPVFRKAKELLDVVQTIVEIIDEEKDEMRVGQFMLENAMLIPAKIAGAEGGDLYSIRLDNATLIKLAARDIMVQTNELRSFKLCDEKYIVLLRTELEEFRQVFHQWIEGFDKENNATDDGISGICCDFYFPIRCCIHRFSKRSYTL